MDTIILKIALFPLSLSYEYLGGPITRDMLLELGTNLNASTNQNFSLCMENACRKSQFYEYQKFSKGRNFTRWHSGMETVECTWFFSDIHFLRYNLCISSKLNEENISRRKCLLHTVNGKNFLLLTFVFKVFSTTII